MIFTLFLVATGATLLGAIAGLGGGVIIKPVMQLITPYTLLNINILSSITVFTMASTSLLKVRKQENFKLFPYASSLVIGSMLGGFIGNQLFNLFSTFFKNENALMALQTALLLLLLIFVLISKRWSFEQQLKQNSVTMTVYGAILAILCAFLGIGGGPINVAFFLLFLKVDIKQAALMSIFIIFFSQLVNIGTYTIDGSLFTVTLSPLLTMIPGAIIGGIVGTELKHKLAEHKLMLIYNCTIVGLILLNTYNLISYL